MKYFKSLIAVISIMLMAAFFVSCDNNENDYGKYPRWNTEEYSDCEPLYIAAYNGYFPMDYENVSPTTRKVVNSIKTINILDGYEIVSDITYKYSYDERISYTAFPCRKKEDCTAIIYYDGMNLYSRKGRAVIQGVDVVFEYDPNRDVMIISVGDDTVLFRKSTDYGK